jgi:predicted transcriptional regulator
VLRDQAAAELQGAAQATGNVGWACHTAVMAAELRLALPWAPWLAEQVGDLSVRRGEDDVLVYDDGITLEVRVLDPARYRCAEDLLDDADEQEQPGQVVLAAGVVPISWRDVLRDSEVAFIDVSGVMDINWPRLRVTAARFAPAIPRQPAVMALQQGHALILAELLIAASRAQPTISKLASGAGVSLSTASRAIAQLCEHGLATKQHNGGNVVITLADRVAAAGLLAAQTAWPGDDVTGGYLDARDGWELAARISGAAARAGTDLAVTGGTGAAFLGFQDAPPPVLRCWVVPGPQPMPAVLQQLGLEPAAEEHANVLLAADTWRVGMHRRGQVSRAGQAAAVAHPVRVWCDLHSEPQGSAGVARLGEAVIYGSRSQSRR